MGFDEPRMADTVEKSKKVKEDRGSKVNKNYLSIRGGERADKQYDNFRFRDWKGEKK